MGASTDEIQGMPSCRATSTLAKVMGWVTMTSACRAAGSVSS